MSFENKRITVLAPYWYPNLFKSFEDKIYNEIMSYGVIPKIMYSSPW